TRPCSMKGSTTARSVPAVLSKDARLASQYGNRPWSRTRYTTNNQCTCFFSAVIRASSLFVLREIPCPFSHDGGIKIVVAVTYSPWRDLSSVALLGKADRFHTTSALRLWLQ